MIRARSPVFKSHSHRKLELCPSKQLVCLEIPIDCLLLLLQGKSNKIIKIMIVALIIPAVHAQKKNFKKTFNKTNQCRDFVREIYAGLLMGTCHFVVWTGFTPTSIRRCGSHEDVRSRQDQRQPAHILVKQEVLRKIG